MQDMRRAALLTAREKIEFADRPVPRAGRGEVLIRMKAVGVCGSDVAYFRTGRTGVGEVRFPHIMGHECAGVVAQVGEGVTGFEIGDRVTTEPGWFCGHCRACTEGRYNLCEHMSFMGSAVADIYGEGALIESTIRPADLVFKLPDGVDDACGAMIEPFSVGMQAARTAALEPGQRAAILGCGPIAMCTLMLLNIFGVRDVLMTDIVEGRVRTMQSLGADARNTAGMDAEALSKLVESGSVDAVFDTTCYAPAINASMRWLKKGGKIVQIGVAGGHMDIDMQTLFNRCISIVPTFRYANTYPALLKMAQQGLLPTDKLITHRFPFAETQRAFETAASRSDSVMKVLIEF